MWLGSFTYTILHDMVQLLLFPPLLLLLLPEAFCFFYCKHELLFQLLIALVWREVQTIKATRHKKERIDDFANKNYTRNF